MVCIFFTFVVFFIAARVEGFAPKQHLPAVRVQTPLHARINQNIDLESPKVATLEKLAEGDKKVYCRCWKSDTFPLCDGAHVAHNKETGDNVGPVILSAAKSNVDAKEVSTEVVDNDVSTEVVDNDVSTEVVDNDASTSGEKKSIIDKLKSMFKKNENAEGLTTKERLAKMGLSALLSYGFVSNMSYAVTLSLSWYGFSKKTGLSPLAPGQWKPFLAVYAGFYVFNNIIRPLRFGASVVVAKYFDNFVAFIQNKTKLSRKWSIAVVVFLANVCGTFAAMGLGVSIASTAAGIPIFPLKS
mmetsp:Transcript_2942/g.6370  ORF Transcript_2942/g.6370 Transcript_2942/m.6370 type:complete len:299 (+) Transcript_2942:103-999(+)|eukprot:CAMPEP_0172314076 /NCGR_PEP_ID=MMETSP1058-20130122/21595_1 /TAXON_ID=83371 /ORGANISM="Detonula confervacea, Strain CCMP 353" /LENGTH=298 /DNA_ID=CAMNT_0013027837 /DNA_START=84 /DNA_END=980 /DNA_ORIENTATION=-